MLDARRDEDRDPIPACPHGRESLRRSAEFTLRSSAPTTSVPCERRRPMGQDRSHLRPACVERANGWHRREGLTHDAHPPGAPPRALMSVRRPNRRQPASAMSRTRSIRPDSAPGSRSRHSVPSQDLEMRSEVLPPLDDAMTKEMRSPLDARPGRPPEPSRDPPAPRSSSTSAGLRERRTPARASVSQLGSR